MRECSMTMFQSRGPLWVCLCAGMAVCASAALGQDDTRRLERALRSGADDRPDYRLQVDTNLTLEERTQFEVGGFFSMTGLWLNDSTENSRRLIQPEVSLYARGSIDGVHSGFVRLRFPYRDFSPGDSFDGRGDGWVEPFLDRYTYEFDYRRAVAAYEGRRSDNNINLKIGRQFVDFAQGLIFSDVLLSVRPTVTLGDRFEIEGLFGLTPDRTVDFDSSRADFDRHTRRAYYGGKVQYTTETGRRYYVFGVTQVDHNGDTENLRTPLPGLPSASFTYDSSYVGFGTEGSIGPDWTYLFEGVYEFGSSTSDPVRSAIQTREDISAYAAKAQVTYLFRDEGFSRAQIESLIASGDSDRGSSSNTVNGNLSGSDDRGYNGLGFANTGLAFAPSLSNLWLLRGGFSTFPMRRDELFEQLQVGADLLIYGKHTSEGGFDEPTKDRVYLGSEIDLFGNWRLTSDFAVNLRYGVFFPGTAIAGPKSARHYVLAGFTLSF